MIKILQWIMGGLFLLMASITIVTSLQSNLFKELPALVQIPWMAATLIDFYILIILVSLWVLYKEQKPLVKILWLLAFVGLGSMGVTAYVWLQLQRLKSNDSVEKIFFKKRK